MLNLMKVISARIDKSGYDVFFNEKPLKQEYPFVVFNIRNSNATENRDDVFLDVDIWTKNQIEVFIMTKEVDKLLERYKYIDDDIQVSIYKVNQLNNMADDDIQVKRNQLKYIVKTYFTDTE